MSRSRGPALIVRFARAKFCCHPFVNPVVALWEFSVKYVVGRTNGRIQTRYKAAFQSLNRRMQLSRDQYLGQVCRCSVGKCKWMLNLSSPHSWRDNWALLNTVTCLFTWSSVLWKTWTKHGYHHIKRGLSVCCIIANIILITYNPIRSFSFGNASFEGWMVRPLRRDEMPVWQKRMKEKKRSLVLQTKQPSDEAQNVANKERRWDDVLA